LLCRENTSGHTPHSALTSADIVAAINWGDRLDGTLTGHVRPEPDSCTAQPITDGRNL